MSYLKMKMNLKINCKLDSRDKEREIEDRNKY